MGDIIWMAPYSTTILHSIAYMKYSNIYLKTLFMFMWALTMAFHRMKNLFRFSYSQNLAYFEGFWSEHFIKHTYLKSLFLKSVMQYYIVTSFVLYIELVNCVLHIQYRLGCLKIASEKSCPYFHLLLYKSSTSPK